MDNNHNSGAKYITLGGRISPTLIFGMMAIPLAILLYGVVGAFHWFQIYGAINQGRSFVILSPSDIGIIFWAPLNVLFCYGLLQRAFKTQFSKKNFVLWFYGCIGCFVFALAVPALVALPLTKQDLRKAGYYPCADHPSISSSRTTGIPSAQAWVTKREICAGE